MESQVDFAQFNVDACSPGGVSMRTSYPRSAAAGRTSRQVTEAGGCDIPGSPAAGFSAN
ncbi:hypothetical protein [Mesorhizobium sp.]|uniref:hypothetical protein n=1 Tax=Mesorhizobium sp. TaxID=1871066 RepID=UPI002579A3B3